MPGADSSGRRSERLAKSSSAPRSSRLREESSCFFQRRTWRARKPSGRPKPSSPTSPGRRGAAPRGCRPSGPRWWRCARPRGLELGGEPVRRPLHPLHHVERGAEHVGVLAQGVRRGHRDVGRQERRHHPVLAGHVVRGRQHVTERRPAHDPPVLAVGDLVGEVGLAAGDHLRTQRSGHRTRPDGLEERLEPGQVQAGRVDGAGALLGHQSTRTETVSATQAGLSLPSSSMVTRTVACAPCGPRTSSSSSAPPRTREPTGTGAGNRTLLEP